MELYQRGIKQPLPFFPKSSKKFYQYRNDPEKTRMPVEKRKNMGRR